MADNTLVTPQTSPFESQGVGAMITPSPYEQALDANVKAAKKEENTSKMDSVDAAFRQSIVGPVMQYAREATGNLFKDNRPVEGTKTTPEQNMERLFPTDKTKTNNLQEDTSVVPTIGTSNVNSAIAYTESQLADLINAPTLEEFERLQLSFMSQQADFKDMAVNPITSLSAGLFMDLPIDFVIGGAAANLAKAGAISTRAAMAGAGAASAGLSITSDEIKDQDISELNAALSALGGAVGAHPSLNNWMSKAARKEQSVAEDTADELSNAVEATRSSIDESVKAGNNTKVAEDFGILKPKTGEATPAPAPTTKPKASTTVDPNASAEDLGLLKPKEATAPADLADDITDEISKRVEAHVESGGLWDTPSNNAPFKNPYRSDAALLKNPAGKSADNAVASTDNVAASNKEVPALLRAKATSAVDDVASATDNVAVKASANSLESVSSAMVAAISKTAGNVLSVEDLKGLAVAKLPALNRLINSGRVVVVNDVEELSKVTGKSHPSDVAGMYDKASNTSYIVAGNTTKEEALGVVLHEVAVHQGLAQSIGVTKWGRIEKAAESIPEISKMAEKLKGSVPKGKEIEEAIAYFIQNSPTTKETKGVVGKVVDAVKAWAVKTVGAKAVKMDADLLRKIAVDSIKQIDSATLSKGAGSDGLYSLKGLGAKMKEAITPTVTGSNSMTRVADKLSKASTEVNAFVKSINTNMRASANPVFNVLGSILYHDANKIAKSGSKGTTSIEQEVVVARGRHGAHLLQEIDASLTDYIKEANDGTAKFKVLSRLNKRDFYASLSADVKEYKLALINEYESLGIKLRAQVKQLQTKLDAQFIDDVTFDNELKALNEEYSAMAETARASVIARTKPSVVRANDRIAKVVDNALNEAKSISDNVTQVTRRAITQEGEDGLVTVALKEMPDTDSSLKSIASLVNSETYFTLRPNYGKFNSAINQYGYSAVMEAMFESLRVNHFVLKGIKETPEQLAKTRDIAHFLTHIGADVSGRLDNSIDIYALSKTEILKKFMEIARVNPNSLVAKYTAAQMDDLAVMLAEINTESKSLTFLKGRVNRNLSQAIKATNGEDTGLKLADLYEDDVIDGFKGYIDRVGFEIGAGNATIKNVYSDPNDIKGLLALAKTDSIDKLHNYKFMYPVETADGKPGIMVNFTHNDFFDDSLEAAQTSIMKDTQEGAHQFLQETYKNSLRVLRGGDFNPTDPSELFKLAQTAGQFTKAAWFTLAQLSMITEAGKAFGARFSTAGFNAIPEFKSIVKQVWQGKANAAELRAMNDIAPAFNIGYDIPHIFNYGDSAIDKANKVSKNYANGMLDKVGYFGMDRFVKVGSYKYSMGELRDLGRGLIEGKDAEMLISRWSQDGLGTPEDVMRIARKVGEAFDDELGELDVDKFRAIVDSVDDAPRMKVQGSSDTIAMDADFKKGADLSTLSGAMSQKIKRSASEATLGQLPAWFNNRWFNILFQFNSTAVSSLPAHLQHALNNKDKMLAHEVAGSFIGAALAYIAKAGIVGLSDEEEMDRRLEPTTMLKNIYAMSSYSAVLPRAIDASLGLAGQSAFFGRAASATGRDWGTIAPPALTYVKEGVQGLAALSGLNPNAASRDILGATRTLSVGIGYIPGAKDLIKEYYPNVTSETREDFVKDFLLPDDANKDSVLFQNQ